MKKRGYYISMLIFGGLFFLPLKTDAAVTAEYDGCFDYVATETAATVHMLDLRCAIVLEADSTGATWSATIANFDPHYYSVKKNGVAMNTVTYNRSTMQFSLSLDPETITTIDIAPWEDLDAQEQMTVFAGGDPQNTPSTDVPNEVFVDFMNYAATINQLLFVVAGDVIRGDHTDADVQEYEYQETVKLIQKTPVTMLATVGDHDAFQDYEQYFERYLGNIPRVVHYNDNLEFFLINSTESTATEGKIADSTMTWLEDELQQSDATYKVVVVHHPFDPPDGALSIGVDDDDKLALAQLLADYNVQIAFVGDAHWYDVDTIDSDTPGFEGLQGYFLQLVMGGLGGSISTYKEVHPDTADHFMMMVTFGDPEDDDGITYTRLTKSDLDISKEDLSKNDGTEQSIRVRLTNNGAVAIPQMRVKFFGAAPRNNTYYAFTSDGEVLETTSHQFGDTQRGYVEIENIAPQKTLDVTMAAVQTPYQEVVNRYKKDGTIQFSSLPQSTEYATDIVVKSADYQGEITVSAWDRDAQQRVWTETAKSKSAKTRYAVKKLDAYREYAIFVNGSIVDQQMADNTGKITFSYSGVKERDFEIIPRTGLTPVSVGTLPAAKSAAQFRLYKKDGTRKQSFRAFSADRIGGFESAWLDADNDGSLEVAIAPEEGTPARLRLYEKKGTRRAGVYPFGKSFTGGLALARADLAGTGKEMLLVGQKTNGGDLRVYEYKKKKKQFVKHTTIQPFGRSFQGGVVAVAADVDGDGDDEVVVASRTKKSSMRLYDWDEETNSLRLIDEIAFGGTRGLSIAAGDVNANGRDEIAALTHGGYMHLIGYAPESNRLKKLKGRRVFESAGESVVIANMNSSRREEIVVAARGQVKLFGFTKKKAIQKKGSMRPFGEEYTRTLTLGITDHNRNQQKELAVGMTTESGQIALYRFTSKKRWKNMASYYPYGRDFIGGVQLTR